MIQHCDGECPGYACTDCGEHVHPWEGEHLWYCEPGIRRWAAEQAVAFAVTLSAARAVVSPTGMVHDVECQTVKAHITWAYQAGPVNWRPWMTTSDLVVTGKSCHLCSPPVTIQARPRRLFIKLTGIGWPDDDGRCTKGHLPRWTRDCA